MRLMDRLSLPKAVLMLANLAIKNGSRRVEEDATPKLLLGAVWKINKDIDTASRPELLVVQPVHSLDEGRILDPGSLDRDLNGKVNEACELHVVQSNELLFESDLASHARDAA